MLIYMFLIFKVLSTYTILSLIINYIAFYKIYKKNYVTEAIKPLKFTINKIKEQNFKPS